MDVQFSSPVRPLPAAPRLKVRESGQLAHRGSLLVQHDDRSAERSRLEHFIADQFRTHFGAELTEFMPSLAGLYGADGSLRAAVGYRPATDGELFLESYTSGPIEVVMRELTGWQVAREEIVEVGSLACSNGRAAMDIVRAIIPRLIEEGFSYVVLTGADTIRNVFRRMNLKPVALCIANRTMLGERQAQWGSYYDHNPIVMAGRLVEGISALLPVGGRQ